MFSSACSFITQYSAPWLLIGLINTYWLTRCLLLCCTIESQACVRIDTIYGIKNVCSKESTSEARFESYSQLLELCVFWVHKRTPHTDTLKLQHHCWFPSFSFDFDSFTLFLVLHKRPTMYSIVVVIVQVVSSIILHRRKKRIQMLTRYGYKIRRGVDPCKISWFVVWLYTIRYVSMFSICDTILICNIFVIFFFFCWF